MKRRISRSNDFEITLNINRDDFIQTPREAQRNWFLNRSMKEFSDELVHLDQLAKRCVPGSQSSGFEDRTQTELQDEDIMEDWQIPIMKKMASIVGESHGNILEIGFGKGIASTFVQEFGVTSHTFVECNDSVVRRYDAWKQQYPNRRLQLFHGRWQDMVDQTGIYDGILFHTYPLNEQELVEHVIESETFAEHFFTTAAEHLRDGGIFTYLTNEIDSLSRGHQRLLFRNFTSFSATLAEDLDLPRDTRDALWVDSMVIIKVVK